MLPPGEGEEGWLLLSVLYHLELVLLYLLFNTGERAGGL